MNKSNNKSDNKSNYNTFNYIIIGLIIILLFVIYVLPMFCDKTNISYDSAVMHPASIVV
jgi:uncharacterized membrane protein YukC